MIHFDKLRYNFFIKKIFVKKKLSHFRLKKYKMVKT